MGDGRSFPGVFIEEIPGGVHSIEGVPTSEAAFVDFYANGPTHEAKRVDSFADFATTFGGIDTRSEASYAIRQFFLNGGTTAWVVRVATPHEPLRSEWNNGGGLDAILGRGTEGGGIYALRGTGFNVLCLPAAANLSSSDRKVVYDEAAKFCHEERAFLIIDIPPDTDTPQKIIACLDDENSGAIARDKNAAVYFPRLIIQDPINNNQPRNVGASGTLAGVYARFDEARGVWKAPAGVEAQLIGVDLAAPLDDAENAKLTSLAINALRHFPNVGNVSWGARTLEGADGLGSEWKYVPVRRTALFIEESIYRGTKWAVFEPNDEPLWRKIRFSVSTFMQNLFRSGVFQGQTPAESYFVKCDRETTTQEAIDRGVVNILVGFAPLKPAEFVIIRIQQPARQTAG